MPMPRTRLGLSGPFRIVLGLAGAIALGGALAAQMRIQIDPVALDDRTGFVPMFDGTSLAGWEGDTAFWRAEGGLLVGETTAAKPLPANTFLIYTKSQPSDFELKLDFRITAGNTGLQYRSQRAPDIGPYVLKGYQADIDFANQWTGQLYEERGRTFLALPGQATTTTGDKPRIIGTVTPAEAIKAAVNVSGWNTLHVIARKELVVHAINGKVTAVFLDGDAAKRPTSGFIGLQLHMGPPMRAEFRNIAIKELK
jgi:hypothetical protein